MYHLRHAVMHHFKRCPEQHKPILLLVHEKKKKGVANILAVACMNPTGKGG